MGGEHWEMAYAAGDTGKSWYQAEATVSLRLIADAASPTSSVIDVGGGASTLVDGLLEAGWTDLTVLDIADAGMSLARARLGEAAERVTWVTTDVLEWRPHRRYDVWHDRAVLHFLVDDVDRVRYRDQLLAATTESATVVIGSFGPAGPESCSGLPVRRANAADLMALLEPQFEQRRAFVAEHRTPAGGIQQFQWLQAVRVTSG